MEIVLPKIEEIQKLSTLGLIKLLISLKDKRECEPVKTVLYDKFKAKLWTRIKKVVWNSIGNSNECEEIAEEMHQDSFLRFFQAIDKNKFNLTDGVSENEAFNKITAWLSRTANYLMLDYIRTTKKQRDDFAQYIEYTKLCLDEGETFKRKVMRSYDLAEMQSVLKSMKPIEKDIIALSHQYACFPTIENKNTKQFPKDVRKDVCNKYGVNDDYFRKAKQIAFAKIIACRINNDNL